MDFEYDKLMNKSHMIWSSFPDFDDWDAGLKEDYPDADENERYQLMLEINGEYLNDERANLGGVRFNEPILVLANLGLWSGRHEAYREIKSGRLSDCFYSNYDPEWYVTDAGEFCCQDHHHDGTNYYVYRVWKPDTTDEQKDDLWEKLYDHTATMDDVNAVTKPLGPDIAKVYGWTITPLQATA